MPLPCPTSIARLACGSGTRSLLRPRRTWAGASERDDIDVVSQDSRSPSPCLLARESQRASRSASPIEASSSEERWEAIGAPWGVAWVAAYLGKRDSGAEPSQTTWWASDSTWSHVPGSARPGAAATPDSSATASSSAHAPQDSRLEAGDGADALVGLLGTTSPVPGSTCPTSLRLPWRDCFLFGSHLASASHAHAAPVRPSACLIGATPALPAVRGPRHALCDAWRGHRTQDMGAGRAPMHNSST